MEKHKRGREENRGAPQFSVCLQLQGLEELVVLLLRPALARLGDGVGLPHLLAGVVARHGGGRLGQRRRRRRVRGDHMERTEAWFRWVPVAVSRSLDRRRGEVGFCP